MRDFSLSVAPDGKETYRNKSMALCLPQVNLPGQVTREREYTATNVLNLFYFYFKLKISMFDSSDWCNVKGDDFSGIHGNKYGMERIKGYFWLVPMKNE